MKIAIIGYGKMGRLIEEIAQKKGLEITSIVDPKHFNNRIDKETVSKADVCIDFSHPDVVLDNIENCLELGKNIVVGTTGWDTHLQKVKNWVAESDRGLIYAPNFSIGVNIFIKLVEKAAKLLKDYDVAGVETHHKEKADAPSGTALAIQAKCSMPFNSIRVGNVAGIHEIVFDSPVDNITLTHQAKNREGFALGAVDAAMWIKNKKGFYTIGDMLTC